MNLYHRHYVDVLVAFDPFFSEAKEYCGTGDVFNTRMAIDAIRKSTTPGTERFCKMAALYEVAPEARRIARMSYWEFAYAYTYRH